MKEYALDLGEREAGGKTKDIFGVPDNLYFVDVGNKDDVTTGDGVRHFVLAGKGVLSCAFTSNAFRYLGRNGVRTHFSERRAPAMFRALRVVPIKIECIGRGVAFGSLLKRRPGEFESGQILTEPLVDFSWKDDEGHDPYMVEGKDDEGRDGFWLHPMGKPASKANRGKFILLEETGLRCLADSRLVRELTQTAYDVYRRGMRRLGFVSPDLKLEFGYTNDGVLVVQDVVDFESGRLWPVSTEFPNGNPKTPYDKQFARDLKDDELTDANKSELLRRYITVTEASYLLAA